MAAVLCSRKSPNIPCDLCLTQGLVLIKTTDVNRVFSSIMENQTIDVNSSSFIPIPELSRSDGDVQVIFLAGNGISFYEQTEDAWYRGTALGYEIEDPTLQGTRRVYWPEEAASPLGCVTQFQFCNTALSPDKRCGPLASWNDAYSESAPLFNITRSQVSDDGYVPMDPTSTTLTWIVLQLNNAAASLYTLLQTLGPESLSSKASLIEGFMGRLPSNQWQLDVMHWWSTYLASIQGAFVETAIGPADPTGGLEEYKQGPWNDYVQVLCNNQVRIISQQFFLHCTWSKHVRFHP